MKADILIAEDSPTQSLKLEHMLESHGYSVRTARNGRLALEQIRQKPPTLVITDIQMPEMDGYELCRAIKNGGETQPIPVMLLTSLSAPQDIIQGLECGADNFVVKPWEEDFLLSRIESMLANEVLRSGSAREHGIPIVFAGKQYLINSDRRQILTLLLTTYETAVKTNLDLIKTHNELKAVQEQLIEAEKLQSVGRLAAGVAHEIKNPLAILEMGMSFLQDQPLREDGKMILGEMQEAVRRTNEVIGSLMEMSSARSLGMQPGNLNAVMEEALRTVEKQRVAADIALARELAPDLPAARLDFAKIEQVFVNVLVNAIQAMPKGGMLTVRSSARILTAADVSYDVGDRSGARLREGERAVVIEVSDAGEGISAENLGRVFEPFFSTRSTGKGMGLGLTVARKIMESHRGSIRVHSHGDGSGTLVIMAFKIA